MATKFTDDVINIIAGIPRGRVMSYGAIAALAGSPRAARHVVRILHSSTAKHDLPWHRVVNSKGEIAFKNAKAFAEQKSLLEAEGVEISAKGEIAEGFIITPE